MRKEPYFVETAYTHDDQDIATKSQDAQIKKVKKQKVHIKDKNQNSKQKTQQMIFIK